MGRKQSYPVRLSEEEREQLRAISRTGKQSSMGDAASANLAVERRRQAG